MNYSTVRPHYVAESKQLSEKYGISAAKLPKFTQVPTSELQMKLVEYDEVLSITRYFMDKLLESMSEPIPLLVAVTDNEATILQISGDEAVRQMMNRVGFKVGVRFSEEGTGTNTVNLCLRLGQPIQLIGDDHYHEVFQTSACYSAPFRFNTMNDLCGCLSFMTAVGQHNPLLISMLQTTVDSIEREIALRQQNNQLHILNQIMMDTSKNSILVTNQHGVITEFNKAAKLILGGMDLIGKSVYDLLKLGTYFKEVLTQGKRYEDVELDFINLNCAGIFDAYPLLDDDGNIIGAYALFREMTARFETEAKISHMAFHDELTALPNRRKLIQELNAQIHRPDQQPDEKLAIVFLDLDRFKFVNDTLGHSEGDRLLKQVAIRLKECMVSGDIVARMGGDEFMILLPQRKNEKEVSEAARKILNVFDSPFKIDVHEFHLSGSMGIALYPDNGNDVDKLMIYADSAMYRAKGTGKSTFKFFEPKMRSIHQEQFTLETALRRAIENNELFLHYQPQIDTASGEMLGVEALVRWYDPDMGLVPPSKFIPVAEETGLILALGDWVLKEACRQNKEWQDAGYRAISISVNLSGMQFSKENLLETINDILTETGLPPHYLELEITETMTMDVNHAINTLKSLQKIGVRVAMDDFGTGYSSLNHLKRFCLQRLKIDKSFIGDLMTDHNDADIVSAIILMAHRLGLRVIAEGVETKEQFEFLLSHRCDEIQGFYFSKPLPPEALITIFQQ